MPSIVAPATIASTPTEKVAHLRRLKEAQEQVAKQMETQFAALQTQMQAAMKAHAVATQDTEHELSLAVEEAKPPEVQRAVAMQGAEFRMGPVLGPSPRFVLSAPIFLASNHSASN